MKNKQKQKFFFEDRILFAHGENPNALPSSKLESATGPEKNEKPITQQNTLELKFTAEQLFNRLDQSSTNQPEQLKIIAQLKQIARLSNKDPKGVFSLGYMEARAWFKSSDLLPNPTDRIKKILSTQEAQLQKVVSAQLIQDIRLLRGVAGERYQRTAANLVEASKKSIVEAIKIAATAFRRHQKMRSTILADPELKAAYLKEIKDYKAKATKPSWSDEYQILVKYHEMAIGQRPRPQNGPTFIPSPKNKPDNAPKLSERNKTIVANLDAFDTFVSSQSKPPMIRNSVEGRWIREDLTEGVAIKWLKDPNSVSQKEIAYLARALNTSENSRARTIITFCQVARRMGDSQLYPILAKRIGESRQNLSTAIDADTKKNLDASSQDVLSQSLLDKNMIVLHFKSKGKTKSYKMNKISLLLRLLSTDGEGQGSAALEGRGTPSKSTLTTIFFLFNQRLSSVSNYLYNEFLTPEEAKQARAGKGDLRQFYLKIVKGFEDKRSSSDMPPQLAIIKDNGIVLSHFFTAHDTTKVMSQVQASLTPRSSGSMVATAKTRSKKSHT